MDMLKKPAMVRLECFGGIFKKGVKLPVKPGKVRNIRGKPS